MGNLIHDMPYLAQERAGNRRFIRISPQPLLPLDSLSPAFLSVSEWARIYFLWRPNLPDEGDNHLIELALAGSADRIITNNTKDLIHGQLRFPSLQIQTPEQFIKSPS